MKILLVKPHFKELYGNLKSVATEYPPLGLMYLASCIEQSGNNVKIIDMSAENSTGTDYVKTLTEYKPDIVGFTVTTPLSNYSHKLAAITKETLSDVKIIFGGPHPTAIPEEELKDLNVDFVIRGEGEVQFRSLLGTQFGNPEKINGISYRKNRRVINNPSQSYIEHLDALPFPAYHLISIKRYYFVDARKHPLAPLLTSRGCPYRCIYCNKNIFGNLYRYRSPKSVVDEIEFLINNYNVKEIHIIDDGFTNIPKRALEICDEIERRELDILLDCANGIRVNTVNHELLSRMKDVGFYKVAYGIESGDKDILNNIRKGITIEQIKEAVKIAKDVGLEVWGFFMIGLPGDTLTSVEHTLDFAIELDLDAAKFFITTPLPGTDLFNTWKSKGYIKEQDWSKFSFYSEPVYEHPGFSKSELLNLQKVCFRRFYFRPKYIYKKLHKISSLGHLIQLIKASSTMASMSVKR